MSGAGVWLLFALLAQPSPEAERAIASATNAFEYRDMKKVIQTLEPWVHPPRIADPALLLEARRLLGVAYHLEGRIADAKDEFAAILMASPKTRLDPFLVPPEVIETFESVRLAMAPALGNGDPRRLVPSVKEPPSRLLPLLPFGLGHMFGLDQIGLGLCWMAIQLGGLATNLVAYHAANGLLVSGFVPEENRGQLDALHSVQVAGLALLFAGWAAGVIQGEVSLATESPTRLEVVPTGAGGAVRVTW